MAKPKTLLQIFSKNVRLLRQKSGMTQAEVAKRVGCSPQYVSQLERGERNPDLDVLQKVGRGFGVEPTELIQDGGGNDESARAQVRRVIKILEKVEPNLE